MGFSQNYPKVPEWIHKPEGYKTGEIVKYQGNIFIADFWASKPGEGDPNTNGWRLYDELYDRTSSPATEPAKIIGYIPTWRKQEGFDYANAEMYCNITHGIVSFLMFSETELGQFEPKTVNDVNAILRDVIFTGHQCGTHILIALGGATDYGFLYLMERIGKNPADPLLQKAVKNVVDFVESNGLDGVDLDLECWWDKNNDANKDQGGRLKSDGAHPAGKGLTEFAKQLKQAMPDKIISSAVFATSWYGNCYDPELIKYVDWLGIMTYDLTGSWNQSPVGPQTALLKIRKQEVYSAEQQGEWPRNRKSSVKATDPMLDNPILSVEDSLWYWTNPFFTNWQGNGQKLPRNKIATGVPIYGYDFAYGKEPDDLSGQVPPGYKVIRYKDLLNQFSNASKADNANIKVSGDTPRPPFISVLGSYPYAHNIYFETPDTAVAKLDFLKRVGAQGVIIWELSNDVWESEDSITKALYKNSGNPQKQPKNIDILPNDAVETDAKSPAVAVNDDGIAVKVYERDGALFIRVGYYVEEGFNWLLQEFKADSGSEPSLALNNEGYVVLVYEKSSTNHDLFCRIGRAGSSGFFWSGSPQKYGQGIRPYVTLSNANLVIATHQKGFELWNQQLVYNVGKVSGGVIDFLTQSIEYVKGREPAITVVEQDSKTVVVEVHMSDGIFEKLWVRVGEVQPDGHINWWGSDVEYDTGKHSSIAATNDGYIVEVHRSDGEYAKLWYRIGYLDISAKGVKWITQQAIAYATGEYPYVCLARNHRNYILIEAHGADVFDVNTEDEESPPNFVSMRGSIPLVQEILEQSDFFERVSVDLGSHGLCLSDDKEQLHRCELQIAPSRAQAYFDSVKLILNFIPFVGDLVSIIENSIACRDGETAGCVGLSIDAAFLALEIVPGLGTLKGTGKAVGSAVEGITRASRQVPTDNLIRTLDESNLNGLGRWWRKRQEARANVDWDEAFPCLRSVSPDSRKLDASVSSEDKNFNLSFDISITPSVQGIATTSNQIPTLNLSDLSNSDLSKINLGKEYNKFIKGLRDDFEKAHKIASPEERKQLEKLTFLRHITMGKKTLVLEFRKSDLYIVKAGTPEDLQELSEKQTRYQNTSKRLIVNKERITSDFEELIKKNFSADNYASEHLRLYAGLFAEATRFGLVRKGFADIFSSKQKEFDLARYTELINDYQKISHAIAGPGDPKRLRVGIADPELGVSGDGKSYNTFFDGATCKTRYPGKQ
ncbi:glycoside hydrolase family 18 protein [Nostoc sp. LEGE 12447]|uniref:glycoside hydrolase family 18 protein n=1 Tax=Nostoc sp. LEGE 12447 TaxID=1828640 RepID=UPI001883D962|nr:glycoside hydrolase family 18 protein [Nostoc sp. LEGE 12447]MBE9001867.1 glycoside hydrolase family 18 protein [Nostoc sp. LEGE 12447]